MAEAQEISPNTPIQKENDVPEQKTPLSVEPIKLGSQESSGMNSGKTCTPDRLKVPKAFKYPERYTSPTDLMMSPITKGLLARSKKANMLIPPSSTPPKIQSFQVQEMGVPHN